MAPHHLAYFLANPKGFLDEVDVEEQDVSHRCNDVNCIGNGNHYVLEPRKDNISRIHCSQRHIININKKVKFNLCPHNPPCLQQELNLSIGTGHHPLFSSSLEEFDKKTQVEDEGGRR